MTERICFRDATVADRASIAALDRVVFPHYPFSEDDIQRWERTPGARFFVSIGANGLLGYVLARISDDVLEVLSLAVRPSEQGRGLGRRLFTYACEMLRRDTTRAAELFARADDVRALAFWKAMGFRQLGVVEKYYADGAAGTRMKRELC